jgi:hypothetical protein
MNDVSSTIVVNLGVFHDSSDGAGEEDVEEAGNANEEDEGNEDGQVEESSDTMGEQCDGYKIPPSLRKPGLPKEVEGVEEKRRDFQEALMRDITNEEEQLIHQSINQDLKLPWGISSQDLSKLREGSINMNIIQVGAALIKKYSSYRTNQKKVPRVFSPKLVRGDLKSLPDGWQTLLPSWPILSISFSSKIDPLGIECVTFVPHACDSGSTVARGQHFPMPL